MALLAQYHSRYHAKAFDPWPGNNGHYLDFIPPATTIPQVERPTFHGIANDLLLASPNQIGLYNSAGGSFLFFAALTSCLLDIAATLALFSASAWT